MRRKFIIAIITLLLFGGVVANKRIVAKDGSIEHTICDGGIAQLSCPSGQVISIVIGNYGRFSSQVCIDDSDNYDPSTQSCENHMTKAILEKKCNGQTSCDFIVNNKTFVDDPCNGTSNYLDVVYKCVIPATTTQPSTTTSTTTTTESSLVEERGADKANSIDETEMAKQVRKESSQCEGRKIRGTQWTDTKAGLTSVANCPEGTNGKQSWYCTDDGEWFGEFPNTAACESNWVITRENTVRDAMKNEDATAIPEILRLLSSDTRRPMVGGDLPKVVDIVEGIVETLTEEPWAKNVHKVSNGVVVDVLNYLLRNQEIWLSWETSKRKVYGDRVIKMLEKLLVVFESKDGETYIQPAISIELSNELKITSQPTDYIIYPSTAVWAPNSADSVNIPREAISAISTEHVRVYFSSFDNLGAQFEPKVMTVPKGNGTYERRMKVVSRVTGATIVHNGKVQSVKNLKRPIRITFLHKESTVRHMSEPTCVWWDHDALDWKPTGCQKVSHNLTMTVCDCDHLTHFAVLMDVNGNKLSETDEWLLTVITYSGCGISIVCLLMTFFAYVIFSRNGGDRVFIHENLCLSLAIAEITFLAGISQTENAMQCSVIALVLMYLFLSALMWMVLEGWHIHRMLTEVFPSDPRRCTYLLVGYGVPAVITLSAWLYNSDGFGTPQHCWLQTENKMIYFFVAPALLMLSFNTVMLLKTLCTVYQHTSGGYLPCRHDVDSGRSIRIWVKGSMSLACLLGVTWTFGLLWVDDGKTVFMAYMFTICNSLQGLFIFLFHVVFAEKMRKDFSHWMYRRGCGSLSSTQSSPNKRTNIPRDMMSPGMNSSSGSEFLYNSNDKYLTSSDTTNRSQYSRMPHPAGVPVYHHHPIYEQQHNGTYDYATIAYGDMLPHGHMNRVAAPPAYQRLAFTNPELAARYGSQQHLYQGWHHRPPPEFSPPPPPPLSNQRPVHYGTGSSGRRPPSSKMSDDSAYSDGSSSMLTTEVTPQGQTVLRIDLNKPNMYCQEL